MIAPKGFGKLPDALRDTGAVRPDRVVVVTDDRVDRLHVPRVIESLLASGVSLVRFVLPAGEASKTLAGASQVYEFLMEQGVHRDAVIIAVGGGMVSDLAGFVAGTWMRGIPLVICPTTLESCVDACLGGKTAINLPGGKNLVGVFHAARLIVVETECLATLDARDIRAGLAESVKHALITSEEYLVWHEKHVEALLSLDSNAIADCIARNLRIKGEIVSRDPYERTGERATLNFGHTIGHALENCAGYLLRHGECVGLGMLAACRLSERIGLDPTITLRLAALLARMELPLHFPSGLDLERILSTLRLDKKSAAGRVRFVLLSAIGQPVLHDDVPESEVRDVIHSLCN